MAEFTDHMEDMIIDQMRNVAGTQVAAYVALFTHSTGLETNLPTGEVMFGTVGGAYSRQLAGLSAAAGGTSSNAAVITFATATADWGTVSHVALVDHVSNVSWGTDVQAFMWSPLDATKTVDSGDQFKINAGELDVTVQ